MIEKLRITNKFFLQYFRQSTILDEFGTKRRGSKYALYMYNNATVNVFKYSPKISADKYCQIILIISKLANNLHKHSYLFNFIESLVF